MSLDLIPYDLPLRSPMATSHAIVANRRGALVRLDDHGTIGWGDLCPMPGWSVQEFESLHDQVDMAGLRLDEDMIGDVLDTLVGARARAALAGAAADVLAQEAGLSLAAHLAPEPLERVAVNATIGAADVSTALTNVYLAIANGIETIKLKVAHRRVEEDIALVESARRAVGDKVELRLDANGGWRPDEALEILHRLAPLDIAVCEEPTAGIDQIAAVGAESPVPVAVDESAHGRRSPSGDRHRHRGRGRHQAPGARWTRFRHAGDCRRPQRWGHTDRDLDDRFRRWRRACRARRRRQRRHRSPWRGDLGPLGHRRRRPLPVEDGAILVPSIPGLGVRPSAAAR